MFEGDNRERKRSLLNKTLEDRKTNGGHRKKIRKQLTVEQNMLECKCRRTGKQATPSRVILREPALIFLF